MWRKVIKKNFKKGLHKNINKVKISKDQLAHGLHRRNEPGDFDAALAARPWWGGRARRAERTGARGARGLRQVPRDHDRCGRCWWRFRSEPAGGPADDAQGALTFPGPRGSGSAAQRPLRPRSLLVHARSVLKDTTETVTASASGTGQPHACAACPPRAGDRSSQVMSRSHSHTRAWLLLLSL